MIHIYDTYFKLSLKVSFSNIQFISEYITINILNLNIHCLNETEQLVRINKLFHKMKKTVSGFSHLRSKLSSDNVTNLSQSKNLDRKLIIEYLA